MFTRICRTSLCSLIAIALAASGCAKRLPPPTQALQHGLELAPTLSVIPLIVADEQPIGFVGFSMASEEREAVEEGRQQRVASRRDARMSGRNSPEGMMFECVIRTLIFFPVCIFVVPAAYGLGSAVEHGRASGKEASVPSDGHLARVGEKIQERITSAALKERTLTFLRAGTQASDEDRYPRLMIRAESARFTHGTVMTIDLNVVAQARPAAGVEWPFTQHRYVIQYAGDQDRLARELLEAQEALAQSIASTYLPAKSAVAAATSPPRAGDVFTYRVVDHGSSPARTMTFTSRVKAVGTSDVEEEIASDESATREWLKAGGRDVLAVGMTRFGGMRALTCPPSRGCSFKTAPGKAEGIKVAAGIFDAGKLVARQTWVSHEARDWGLWKGSRAVTVWQTGTGRILKLSADDSMFGESFTGKFEIELVSYSANWEKP